MNNDGTVWNKMKNRYKYRNNVRIDPMRCDWQQKVECYWTKKIVNHKLRLRFSMKLYLAEFIEALLRPRSTRKIERRECIWMKFREWKWIQQSLDEWATSQWRSKNSHRKRKALRLEVWFILCDDFCFSPFLFVRLQHDLDACLSHPKRIIALYTNQNEIFNKQRLPKGKK